MLAADDAKTDSTKIAYADFTIHFINIARSERSSHTPGGSHQRL